jgi:hypothetical protein
MESKHGNELLLDVTYSNLHPSRKFGTPLALITRPSLAGAWFRVLPAADVPPHISKTDNGELEIGD